MPEIPPNKRPLLLTNAEIFFRNFAGLERQYNTAGQRNFCVAIDPELAEKLAAEGWNVKYRKQFEEGDPVRPYLEVKVNFDSGRPPKCKLITKQNPNGKELTADEVWTLDAVEIERVDLTINPSHWDVNGKKGVKAYLRSIFVTAYQDEIELMYEGPAEEVGATLLPFEKRDTSPDLQDPNQTLGDDEDWQEAV